MDPREEQQQQHDDNANRASCQETATKPCLGFKFLLPISVVSDATETSPGCQQAASEQPPSDELHLHSAAWSLIDASTGLKLESGSTSLSDGAASFKKFIDQIDSKLDGNCLLVTPGPLSLRQYVHPTATRLNMRLSKGFDSYVDLIQAFWLCHEASSQEGQGQEQQDDVVVERSVTLGTSNNHQSDFSGFAIVAESQVGELAAYHANEIPSFGGTCCHQATAEGSIMSLSGHPMHAIRLQPQREPHSQCQQQHQHQQQVAQLQRLCEHPNASTRAELEQVQEIIKLLPVRDERAQAKPPTPALAATGTELRAQDTRHSSGTITSTSGDNNQVEADSLASLQVHYMSLIIEHMLNEGHQFNQVELIKRRLEVGLCDADANIAESTVVRARGLPWQATEQDIANFFVGLDISKGGVALCLSRQGRRNGEALIKFDTTLHRKLALARHKHFMGARYIEVYRATGGDFLSVVSGYNKKAHAFLSRGPQIIVRMRGLPFTCTPKQIVDFFSTGPNGSKKDGCQLLGNEDGIMFVKNQDDKPTGDAFVLFASEDLAQRALQKHHHNIGSRYVELFRSTVSEVQQVLSISMETSSSSGANNNSNKPHELATGGGASTSEHTRKVNNKPIPAAVAKASSGGDVASASVATYAQVATSSNPKQQLSKLEPEPISELQGSQMLPSSQERATTTTSKVSERPRASSKLSLPNSIATEQSVVEDVCPPTNTIENSSEAESIESVAKLAAKTASLPAANASSSGSPSRQQSNNKSLSPISSMSDTSSPALSQASSYKSSLYGVPNGRQGGQNKTIASNSQQQHRQHTNQQGRAYQATNSNNNGRYYHNNNYPPHQPALYGHHNNNNNNNQQQSFKHYANYAQTYQLQPEPANSSSSSNQSQQRHQQMLMAEQHQQQVYAAQYAAGAAPVHYAPPPYGLPMHPAALHAYHPYHHHGYPPPPPPPAAQLAYGPPPQASIHYYSHQAPQASLGAPSAVAGTTYDHQQQQHQQQRTTNNNINNNKRDCIRLRGLPFEAQVEDILQFLGCHSKSIVYQGVHMVYSVHGQPSGEAIVQMNSCQAASQAASDFHMKEMSVGKKHRYIEVMPSSIDDLQLSTMSSLLAGRSLVAPRQHHHYHHHHQHQNDQQQQHHHHQQQQHQNHHQQHQQAAGSYRPAVAAFGGLGADLALAEAAGTPSPPSSTLSTNQPSQTSPDGSTPASLSSATESSESAAEEGAADDKQAPVASSVATPDADQQQQVAAVAAVTAAAAAAAHYYPVLYYYPQQMMAATPYN